MRRRARSQKVEKPAPRQLPGGVIVFSAYPKRVENVPLEYQAAVYAKNKREQVEKQDAKNRLQRDKLRSTLKALKLKLRIVPMGAERSEIEKEIEAQEKAIRKIPKPKSKWSPVLSGSFESRYR